MLLIHSPDKSFIPTHVDEVITYSLQYKQNEDIKFVLLSLEWCSHSPPLHSQVPVIARPRNLERVAYFADAHVFILALLLSRLPGH